MAKYALNLSSDNRILSATYEKFAPINAAPTRIWKVKGVS